MKIEATKLRGDDFNNFVKDHFNINEEPKRWSTGRLAALQYAGIGLLYGVAVGGTCLTFGAPVIGLAIGLAPALAVQILSYDLYKSCCNVEDFFKGKELNVIYTGTEAKELFEKTIAGTFLRSLYYDIVSNETQGFKTLAYHIRISHNALAKRGAW